MFQKIKKLYISKNRNITKKSHWKKGEQFTVTLNAASVEAIREEGEEEKAEKWQNNLYDNYKTTTSIKIEETTRRQEFNYLKSSNRERVVYQSCSCNISSNRNQDIRGERRPQVIEIFRFGQKMANTISVMTNVLRNAVSKQRIRYKEKGFNLDLAYICDNIIAMGYPADNLEKIYRNPLEDVYKFLEENHRDRYKIYNLCLERSYDVNKFHGRVSVYPFEDHNPPTIELIQRFCADVDEWLKADTNNVAAVHCKAGKGRTGTMICCYLIYSNQQQTAEDALAYYDEKRTKDRKGVTIPSQRRYVQYFAKLLRSNLPYTRRSLEFFEIRFTEAHALYSQGTVNCSISALEDSCGCLKVQTLRNLNIDFRKSFTLDMKNFALRVSGDIKIELTQKTSKKKILHFWFNTYFVYDSAMLEGEGENAKLVYTLNKWEIDDAHKDKEHKMFSDDFKVQLAFYNESNDSTDLNRPNDNHHLHRTYPATTPSLPVLRRTVPVPVTAPAPVTMTATTKPCESSNSSNSEMHIICDEQATGIGLGGGGGGGTYENLIDTKPYGNHHQDSNTNTTILTDRRPTSLIALNDTNSSPHKLIQQQQQQQHHRRSVTNTTTSGNHQRQLLQIQHKINTCSSNNHQQQHNNHIQLGKTTMRNINNQSNMSNSSNSSINSHITSVSSSASMASTSGGIISGGKQQQQQQLFINDFNEKHEDDIDDDDEDEDEDNDDDDDEEDDADREDNEEDWESGESAVNKPLPTTTTTTITTTITTTTTISPIRFNEKQLVTNNRTTNSTTNYTTLSTTTATTTIPKTTTKNAKCLKIKEKHQKQQQEEEEEQQQQQHQRQMKKNSSGSSTSSSNYFNEIGDIVHFYNDNGNKVHIDNNYIDDVDDDDDDDENDNDDDDDDDDDNMLNTTTAEVNAATTNNYANNNIQCAANPATTTTTTTFDNDDTKSAKCTNNNINNNNNNKQLMSNLVARYKFMHLLTAKASNKVMAPRHSYFKRKSLKSKSTTLSTTCTTEAASGATQTTKNINCLTNDCYMLAGAAGGNDCVDGVEELRTRTTSVGNSGGCAGGVGGGLAKASKLKLKLGLSKTNSKLKWTQKFHWLQNYVRSADAAADLRKSFAQTTTTTSSQRLNSNSSGNATTITTTTTNTCNCNGIKNSTPSQIVGSSCTEDYYSSICDNQLSFNNSPCKSPRSQKQKHATHVAATAAAAGGPIQQPPTTTLLVNDDVALKVVVVAARPANIESIGFNVTSTTDTTTTTNISSVAGATATSTSTVALGICNITNGSGSNSSSGYATASTLHSDSSIYSTPPTSVLEQQTTNLGVVEHTHHHEKISPFIFPNISAEITELAHVLKSSNIDTKTTATATTTIKNGSIKHNIDNDNENDNDDEFDEHNNKQA